MWAHKKITLEAPGLGSGNLASRDLGGLSQGFGFRFTWTPTACEIMAFWAVVMGVGPSFYTLQGSR